MTTLAAAVQLRGGLAGATSWRRPRKLRQRARAPGLFNLILLLRRVAAHQEPPQHGVCPPHHWATIGDALAAAVVSTWQWQLAVGGSVVRAAPGTVGHELDACRSSKTLVTGKDPLPLSRSFVACKFPDQYETPSRNKRNAQPCYIT